MDHFTVMTDRLEESVAFYTGLGLEVGARPDFTVGGAWLYAGGRPVLHLVELPGDKMPPRARGLIDHIAFAGVGLQRVAEGLKRQGIACALIRAPRPFTQWQLFFLDPNGAEVEIDFDKEEAPPEDWKTWPSRHG
ncbi:MAG: VOC family protein [Sphingobium sp.]|nr:VOC family protein [Sphingobium sp.]